MPYGGAKIDPQQDALVDRIHEAAHDAYDMIAEQLSDIDSTRMAILLLVGHDLMHEDGDDSFTATWVVKRRREPAI